MFSAGQTPAIAEAFGKTDYMRKKPTPRKVDQGDGKRKQGLDTLFKEIGSVAPAARAIILDVQLHEPINSLFCLSQF